MVCWCQIVMSLDILGNDDGVAQILVEAYGWRQLYALIIIQFVVKVIHNSTQDHMTYRNIH